MKALTWTQVGAGIILIITYMNPVDLTVDEAARHSDPADLHLRFRRYR